MDKQKNNSKNGKNSKNSKSSTVTKRILPILLGGIALCLVVGILLWNVKAGGGESEIAQTKDTSQTKDTTQTKDTAQTEEATQAEVSASKSLQIENGAVAIPLSDLSSKAKFYDVEIDGTKLELLAVKASDGTIHTAFNTCQVCYSSGRGYYVQEGDQLVCQNCGNRFPIGEVGVTRNGCNPVPILENERTMDKDSIKISESFFDKYVTIFKNWKTS